MKDKISNFCLTKHDVKFCDPIRPYQIIYRKITTLPLRKKCPCSELFCSAFSPNAGKYGPE